MFQENSKNALFFYWHQSFFTLKAEKCPLQTEIKHNLQAGISNRVYAENFTSVDHIRAPL